MIPVFCEGRITKEDGRFASVHLVVHTTDLSAAVELYNKWALGVMTFSQYHVTLERVSVTKAKTTYVAIHEITNIRRLVAAAFAEGANAASKLDMATKPGLDTISRLSTTKEDIP